MRLLALVVASIVITLSFCLLLPVVIAPRRLLVVVVNCYIAALLGVAGRVGGLGWKFRGLGKRATGPIIVAAKHQSTFETLALQYQLGDPAIILKRELFAIPILGWILRRMGHLGVDRSGGLDDVRRLVAEVRQAHQQGRPVVIFPEGTRRDVAAPPDYKAGVELLYAVLKVPCVPVAVNSGRVWPNKSLLPRSGRIVIELLPPIEAGLPREVFGKRLQREIEEATARLLEEPV